MYIAECITQSSLGMKLNLLLKVEDVPLCLFNGWGYICKGPTWVSLCCHKMGSNPRPQSWRGSDQTSNLLSTQTLRCAKPVLKGVVILHCGESEDPWYCQKTSDFTEYKWIVQCVRWWANIWGKTQILGPFAGEFLICLFIIQHYCANLFCLFKGQCTGVTFTYLYVII